MKRIITLAMSLALVLGIAASSFAATNSKATTPNGKVTMLKVKGDKKPNKHRKHHKHRKHRHHRNSMVKTKNN